MGPGRQHEGGTVDVVLQQAGSSGVVHVPIASDDPNHSPGEHSLVEVVSLDLPHGIPLRPGAGSTALARSLAVRQLQRNFEQPPDSPSIRIPLRSRANAVDQIRLLRAPDPAPLIEQLHEPVAPPTPDAPRPELCIAVQPVAEPVAEPVRQRAVAPLRDEPAPNRLRPVPSTTVDEPRRLPLPFRWAKNFLYSATWIFIVLMAAIVWVPHVTKYKTDVVIGKSMEPTIPLYSVIVVEPVAPEQIRVGDVISFQQPDRPSRKVTHRVVKIERKHGRPVFRTKGDANRTRDPYAVQYRKIGYRVTSHIPGVGWVLLHTQQRSWRFVLVIIPVLVLLFQFLAWIWRSDSGSNADELDDELVDSDEEWAAA